MKPDHEHRIVRELAAQLEDIYRDALSRGMTEEEADSHTRHQVRDWECFACDLRRADKMGSPSKVNRWLDRSEEASRRRRLWGSLFADLHQDVRHALRRLGKNPGFSLVAALTLALGIGANTAIFSLVHGVVLSPLPYPQSDQLMKLWNTAPGLGIDRFDQSPGTYVNFRESAHSFEAIALYHETSANFTGGPEPERIRTSGVTASLFPVLKASPALGRGFSPDDDRPGAQPVAILSHGLWSDAFGADPGSLGRTVQLDGVSHEVIGVMLPGFSFPSPDIGLWIPLGLDLENPEVDDFTYPCIGRLREDISPTEAEAEIEVIFQQLPDRFPAITRPIMESSGMAAVLRPLKQDIVGDVTKTLWLLLGTVGFVLLIACANVANLFLVRAEDRQKEVAMRTALGAGRARITRFYVTEAVILGLAGGMAGLAFAAAGIRLVTAFGPENLPRIHEVGIHAEVLAFTAILSFLTGLAFGALPILRYGRSTFVNALKEGGRFSSGREKHRVRTVLVVSQVALALILLIGSGLMIRSTFRVRNVEPGFNPSNTLTLRLSLPETEYPESQDVARFIQELSDRARSIPGVVVTGATTVLPLSGGGDNLGTRIEDFPAPEDSGVPYIHPVRLISPGYFEAMGIPLLSGRHLSRADQEQGGRVVVVSHAFARKYWPEQETIGKRLSVFGGDHWYTIVGIVGSVRAKGPEQDPERAIYAPLTGHGEIRHSFSLVVRTAGTPESLADVLRGEIWDIDTNLPVANVRTLDEILASATARTSFIMTLLAVAASVSLLLGFVGIYGVIAYIVSLRTREIGIRMALGARREDVSRMVMKQGVGVVLVGILLGLLGATALTQLLQALLFEVSPLDPLTFATVSVIMAAAGLIAIYLPARRAATVDPAIALRAE
jgi:predicted permease